MTRNSTNEVVSSWTPEFHGILPRGALPYWPGRHVALFVIRLADLQHVVITRIVVENCEHRNRSNEGRHGQASVGRYLNPDRSEELIEINNNAVQR